MPTDVIWLIFSFAYGACIGSFLNVVIYRVPAGESLVNPPSHCPHCGYKLAWFDNVPVFAWLWLKGCCRNCAAPISGQYPIIEALTGLLFAGVYHVYFMSGDYHAWAALGQAQAWPILVLTMALAGALVAATLIDARLFIIPISIPWTIAVVGLIVWPLAAWAYPAIVVGDHAILPALSGAGVQRMGLGGAAGLIIANLLLWRKLIPRSFPMPEVDESETSDDKGNEKDDSDPSKESKPSPTSDKKQRERDAKSRRRSWTQIIIFATMAVAAVSMTASGDLWLRIIGMVVLWWGVLLLGLERDGDEDEAEAEDAAEEWYEHPRPRTEATKELLFVAWPVIGALAAYAFGPAGPLPAPLAALGAALFGGLAGAGTVWLVRIGGTLGFGKEAMGLGDVHLMFAVGVVLGWVDSVLAFFIAPFFGLLHTAAAMGVNQAFNRRFRPIPYGPHLAGASLLMIVLNGCRLLEWLFGYPVC